MFPTGIYNGTPKCLILDKLFIFVFEKTKKVGHFCLKWLITVSFVDIIHTLLLLKCSVGFLKCPFLFFVPKRNKYRIHTFMDYDFTNSQIHLFEV